MLAMLQEQADLLGALCLARRGCELTIARFELDVLVLDVDALVLDAGQLPQDVDAVSELRRSEPGQVPINRKLDSLGPELLNRTAPSPGQEQFGRGQAIPEGNRRG